MILPLVTIIMFDWLRKLVAGPKNRLVNEKHDLDLTYITSSIIAMAFPASGFEKTYRNCVEDVAAHLEEHHSGRYFIVNVSNREYDFAPFDGRVKSYEWEDHQAPCLTTLFEIA